ncbi:hypothetical protein ACA910_017845 [Epithemia clementina (nom. ined.)]
MTTTAWKHVGPLKDLDAFAKNYPFLLYEWGLTFNTRNVLPCTVNGWNGSTKLISITTQYLQGDDGANLSFGTAVFSIGTTDLATKKAAEAHGDNTLVQRYAGWNVDSAHPGLSYVGTSKTLGNKEYLRHETATWAARSPTLYVRRFTYPWMMQSQISTMKDFELMEKMFPWTRFEWGTNYNSYCIKSLTVTKWNRGIRIHVTHPYAMGDDGSKLTFGVPCWTCETSDKESQEGFFYHRYVANAMVSKIVASNGKDGFKLFVRLLGDDHLES